MMLDWQGRRPPNAPGANHLLRQRTGKIHNPESGRLPSSTELNAGAPTIELAQAARPLEVIERRIMPDELSGLSRNAFITGKRRRR